MAITNAQQYQQLVKKDANGKRPGYRGVGGYRGGSGGSGGAGGREAPASGGGRGGGGADADNRREQARIRAQQEAARKRAAAKKKAQQEAAARKREQARIKAQQEAARKRAAAKKKAQQEAAANRREQARIKAAQEAAKKKAQTVVKDIPDRNRGIGSIPTTTLEIPDRNRGMDSIPTTTLEIPDRNRGIDSIPTTTPTTTGDTKDDITTTTTTTDTKKTTVPKKRKFDYTQFIPFVGGLNRFASSSIGQLNNALQRNSYFRTLSTDQQAEVLQQLAEQAGIGTTNPMGITRNIERGMDTNVLGFGGQFITDPRLGSDEAKDIINKTIEDYVPQKTDASVVLGEIPQTKTYDQYQEDLIDRSIPDTKEDVIIPTVPKTSDIEEDTRSEIQKLIDARGPAYRFFADGGRAEGILNKVGLVDDDDLEGGIMDLESGRQMYFLGKLVKKATKTIKKIAKSPVGKAALLYFGGNALAGKMGGLGGLKAKLFGTAAAGTKATPGMGPLFKPATEGLLAKLGLTKGGGSFMPTALGGIGLASLAAGLMTPKEEEEQPIDRGPRLDIAKIRSNPYAAMGGAYSFYADGGKAEPVAKKTMPLLDMDGMEKDYRKDGGFVPIGRMERADDVPARLSKNEFVFTADAVRNAGDGDVDKGAEVMYNMMKNLEAGGNISEESQGLDGARKMFQTSQRLEEVL